MQGVVHHEVVSGRPADTLPLPLWVDARLRDALHQRGIERLYRHQGEAIEWVHQGRNVVVVTPTASGKTICYNLPVLNTLLSEPEARALYLFPTKALSQDQVTELHTLVDLLGVDLRTSTFDGDTPAAARRAIRSSGHVVVTNPDMLHAGILPNHTRWVRLFENLRYVVIDELHTYRGVFGSHVANVIRRLHRIARFYGASPLFILSSATIRNPGELATELIAAPVEVVDRNGAPSGDRHVVVMNPPVVNPRLGIRRSVVNESRRVARLLLAARVSTLVFARSRLRAEILTRDLRGDLRRLGRDPAKLAGYRGGYLPLERRAIERGLRENSLDGVVSTNALELGIDIGSLDAVVMAGYPGTVASTWQQAGRAGRRHEASIAVLVLSSSPLDQYIASHPEFLFGASPESGVINPNGVLILLAHARSAAFELPFQRGEEFGPEAGLPEIMDYLEEHQVVHREGEKWHWSSADTFPAADVSLRRAAPENVVIHDLRDCTRVIGEIDYHAAPRTVYEEAIYLHQGETWQVVEFDWEGRRAYVTPVRVDYYTDAETRAEVRVIDEESVVAAPGGARGHGEVSVTEHVPLFKKVRFETHENVGSGKIHLPPIDFHTTAFWIEWHLQALPDEARRDLGGGLRGLAHLLSNLAPLFALCDRRDLVPVPMVAEPRSGDPTLFVYDAYPGGVGLSAKLFQEANALLEAARDRILACPCTDGCPSCVGPPLNLGGSGKESARLLLREALHGVVPVPIAKPVTSAVVDPVLVGEILPEIDEIRDA
jgi:DEAD/DEAH box helicase domain-containing protein